MKKLIQILLSKLWPARQSLTVEQMMIVAMLDERTALRGGFWERI